MAPSPLAARSRAVTAWSGHELLVWHGRAAGSDGCDVGPAGDPAFDLRCGQPNHSDAGAYDPAADTWRVLPDDPLPDESGTGSAYDGVWTGTELLVWGGRTADGAAYDPRTNAWRRIAHGPLAPRLGFQVAWTGTELVVVGGGVGGGGGIAAAADEIASDGAAYDPRLDRWRPIAQPPHPSQSASVAWDGTRVVVAGYGVATGEATIDAYDPRADRWSSLANPPLVTEALVAFDGKVLAEGRGRGHDSDSPPTQARAVLDAEDRWTSVPDAPHVRRGSAVWDGRDLLFVGTDDPVGSDDHAAVVADALDPTTLQWRSLAGPGLTERSGWSAAWTGTELLVWGGTFGSSFGDAPLADGARYNPGGGH